MDYASIPWHLGSRVILVRHGSTTALDAGKTTRSDDEDLSTLGVEQSKLLGHRLSAIAPFYLYSSPVNRALATAHIIAAECSLRPVYVLSEFAESPDDETDTSVLSRIAVGLGGVLNEPALPAAHVIVTHGRPIVAALSLALGISFVPRELIVTAASITVLIGNKIIAVNDTAHLHLDACIAELDLLTWTMKVSNV